MPNDGMCCVIVKSITTKQIIWLTNRKLNVEQTVQKNKMKFLRENPQAISVLKCNLIFFPCRHVLMIIRNKVPSNTMA